MLAQVEVPGFGPALIGLDWLTLSGVDGRRREIRQLGRGVEARWEYVWPIKDEGETGGEDQTCVALVSRESSRKRPVAAAALLNATLHEAAYVVLIEVTPPGEAEPTQAYYWLLAIDNGMPVEKLDVVGDTHTVMARLKDHLNTRAQGSALVVYTCNGLQSKPVVLAISAVFGSD